ncbi:MAG: alpha/beta fold hydrolase [Chloroflexi bacterium]|nr:alpha/beta fold hydrolase [Chloroflexota bacterium]
MIAGALGRAASAAGVAVLGYLAYVAVRGSRALVWPAVRPLVPEPPDAPSNPGDLGFEYDAIRIRTDDGVELAAWFIPAAQPTDTAVVVMHGYSGHRLPELAGFVPWLRERHNVLQFDFRGHGESDAGPVTMGARERRDVGAAVDALRARGLTRIALFGVSMGAAAAILAAPDLPVAAVVADAPYARTAHPIANRMRGEGWPLPGPGSTAIVLGASLRARAVLPDPIDAVGRMGRRALLVIVSDADRLISWRQGVALYERASGPRKLLVIAGAGHGDAYITDPARYRTTVMEFLRRWLSEAEPQP